MIPVGAKAVVRALEDEGVPFAFGIPGTHNIELYDALGRSSSVRPVLVTDERSAAFMADGLWRASGRLGCLNVVPGAGLTHALSGVAEAYLDNVPVLVLGCGVRRDSGRAFQLHDIDQAALARPVTKAVVRPLEGAEIYPAVRRACALAREGAPGPVMVEIPADLYLVPGRGAAGGAPGSAEGAPTKAPGSPGGGDRDGGARATGPAEPAAELVERAAARLRAARRPLLYVGAGAAAAAPELVRLAERLEMPVASTLQGKGVFPESHPLFLWPGFGDAAPAFARRAARGCDATLAIGCRFSEVGTGSYGIDPPRPLVHVDIDPVVFGRNYQADVAIRADAGAFARALLERIGTDPPPAPDEALRRAIREGHEEVWRKWLEAARGDGVSPARLLRSLQEGLGGDAVFVTDSGNGTFLAAECLRLDRPGCFLAPVDFSCMGYSVPAAIGASLGRPGDPVVALVGDGAFLMTGLELLTAAGSGIGAAFLVLRDRELAQIAQFQRTALNRPTCSRLPDYDLEALCRGVGVEHRKLAANDGIDAAVAHVADRLRAGDPIVLEVQIDYSEKTYFTRGVVRTNFARLPWADRLRFLTRALTRRLSVSGR
ncbi:MAG: thiamine pyrophosphate-binding protein [Gemmatimonadota bacterium]